MAAGTMECCDPTSDDLRVYAWHPDAAGCKVCVSKSGAWLEFRDRERCYECDARTALLPGGFPEHIVWNVSGPPTIAVYISLCPNCMRAIYPASVVPISVARGRRR